MESNDFVNFPTVNLRPPEPSRMFPTLPQKVPTSTLWPEYSGRSDLSMN